MNLGDRTAQRHTAIAKTAVVSSDYWDFAPGQRVMTREGFAGVVSAVSDGPYPGAEEYEVTLDAGLGGGSYAPGELRPLDPPLAAEAADQGAIRQRRKSRQTGITVLVIDGQHPDSDVPGTPEEGGRWVTVCDEHGGSCNHLTLEDAKGWAADPQAWCWGCQEMRDQGHTEAKLGAADDHRISWHVTPDGGETWMPRTKQMRGQWGHDAKCSCGWESRTGGGTERYVREKVADHKREVQWNREHGQVEGAVQADVRTAADDYPELGNILEERPDHQHAIPVSASLTKEGHKLMPVTDVSPRPGFDVEASWFSDHATDYLTRHTPTEFRTDPEHAHSVDWCRFRRNSRCFFSHTLDEAATQQAGYVVWTPEDRGFCPRITWDSQRECPIGEPGPNSGAPNAGVEATVPWEQGGQRYGALHAEAFQAEGRWHLTATWRDVRAKAKRIRSEGGVRIIAAPTQTDTSVVAEVRGDHNIYETTITREPGKHAVAMWTCGCAWASYSWGRSGRWKRYEGRMCSHALALTYEVQAKGMFGKTILEDREQPAWRMDPTIPVIQPQNYPKPKRRRASLDRGDAVVIMRHPRYNDAYTAHVEHDGKVWSFDCGHLHHTPEAAKKCIPKVEKDWKAWRDLPREELGFNDVVEMTRALDRPGAVQYRRMSPETDAIRHEGSLRPLETDKALEIAPAVLIAQGMLSQGYSPNETLDTLVDMGLPNAVGMIAEALAVKPFKAKVRGWVRKIVQIVNGNAVTETGDEVPLHAITYPTYDPTLGLDLDDSKPHIAALDDPPRVCALCGEEYEAGEGYKHTDPLGRVEFFHFDCGNTLLDEIEAGERDPDGTWEKLAQADTKGVMVCFQPPIRVREALAKLGTEDVDNIHMTLGYFGKTDEVDGDKLQEAVALFATKAPALVAQISGFGTFNNGPENVLIATLDIPGIDQFRVGMLDALRDYEIVPYGNHGFTPHITLSYGDKPFTKLPEMPDGLQERFGIDHVTVSIGDDWFDYPLQPLGAVVADLASDWAEALTEGYHSGDVDADAVTWFAPSDAGQALGEQGAFNAAYVPEERDLDPFVGAAKKCRFCGQDKDEPLVQEQYRIDSPYRHQQGEHVSYHHASCLAEFEAFEEQSKARAADEREAQNDEIRRQIEGELHDEPEPALPETDGAEEDEEFAPGDQRLGWLMQGGGKDQSNSEIAAMARQYLKVGAKAFTPAEQRQIIDEGEGVLAANFDALDITGTHYMALEEALQKEEDEEDVAWLA